MISFREVMTLHHRVFGIPLAMVMNAAFVMTCDQWYYVVLSFIGNLVFFLLFILSVQRFFIRVLVSNDLSSFGGS